MNGGKIFSLIQTASGSFSIYETTQENGSHCISKLLKLDEFKEDLEGAQMMLNEVVNEQGIYLFGEKIVEKFMKRYNDTFGTKEEEIIDEDFFK